MDVWNQLLAGFATAATPINLMWAFIGCVVGTAVGVLPGIGPAVAVAMLLPITVKVEATASMIFFAGIYYGAMYGGSTTSILLNTPGETGTMVTAMEGNKMAKNGRAGAALATSAIGSFVAGTIATVLVTLFAPIVAEFAVKLGPPEYFCLMLLAFTTVSAVLGKSTLRGMVALFTGLAIGLIGHGPDLGPAALHRRCAGAAGRHRDRAGGGGPVRRRRSAVQRAVRGPVARDAEPHELGAHDASSSGSAPGPPGCAARPSAFRSAPSRPAAREIPTFLSYATERKLARRSTRRSSAREGAIEGVAGPEAANNAAVTATLVPLLTLGIPTSTTAAILLGAFQNYGIQPGPQLFTNSAALVWALIASLYIGNVMLLVLNLPMVGLWVKLLKIPKPHLYAGILIFATVGVYGMRQSAFDLVLLYGDGPAGGVMRRYDFPPHRSSWA
jgi:putative tricarboxylic transport membrane protein